MGWLGKAGGAMKIWLKHKVAHPATLELLYCAGKMLLYSDPPNDKLDLCLQVGV